MLTMTPGTQSQIDDLLDARATVRQLEKELLRRRLAVREIKEKLAAAIDRLEDTFVELEQKQGRLPFGDDTAEAGAPPPAAARPASGRPGKGRKPIAAKIGWSETR
jgi:hypothetical protein